MTLDLDHLRRVAETLVAEHAEGVQRPSTIARHIAAFDPPTVLELIDRLEAAEAKVAGAEEVWALWKQQAEESHLLAMNRAAVLKELYGHPDGPNGEPEGKRRPRPDRSAILATIRAHIPRNRYDGEGEEIGTHCTCGRWEGDYFADGEAGPFDDHLADEVLSTLGGGGPEGHPDAPDAAEAALARVEALARKWSEQLTDYSDDAEQQIEDGHELRETLGMPDDCSCGECQRRRNPPPPMTAEESRAADERLALLLGELNRKASAAITKALDADLTASEDDGGPEGHRDDDNAGERRGAREEGL